MNNRTDPAHIFSLSRGVSPVLDNNIIILRTRRESISVDPSILIDSKKLLEDNSLSLVENYTDMDLLMFNKFIRHLISISWIKIIVHPGIHIEACTLADYDSLFENVTEPEDFSMASGMVIETLSSQIKIIDPKRKLVIKIDQTLYHKIFFNQASPASRILSLLGVFKRSGRIVDEEDLISQAFHFVTTNLLEVMKDDKYVLKKSWSGIPEFNQPQGEFLKILHLRESGKLESRQIPTLEEIHNLLKNVYGARIENNRLKFSYPSPGAGYSIKLKIVYPEDEHEIIYDFDPVKSSFEPLDKSSRMSMNNGWARIYLVGNLIELNKRYQIIPYRLLLQEAGVLLHQLSLVSAFENLKGRIIGYTNEAAVKNVFKKGFADEDLVLGEFLVSSQDIHDE